jgi:alpha-ketoglutarate-dependent taurine dioxygenase
MDVRERISAVPDRTGVCADIEGFDFQSFDSDDIAQVRKIWLEFGVVRFKRTEISDREQVDFSRHFGDFVYHPKQEQAQEGAHPTFPEILVISNVVKDGRPVGALGNNEATWHTDTWFYERPPSAAILRGVQVPGTGGRTCFLSTYEAYETLPDDLKNAVQGRQLFHQNVYDKTGRLRLGRTEPRSCDFREWQGVVHPIVRTHGETGRKCLYLGGTSEKIWVVGMPLDESDEIVRRLWDHVTSLDNIFVQEWDRGDIVIWDNRCAMHRRDALDAGSIRVMHRTTLAGERPV